MISYLSNLRLWDHHFTICKITSRMKFLPLNSTLKQTRLSQSNRFVTYLCIPEEMYLLLCKPKKLHTKNKCLPHKNRHVLTGRQGTEIFRALRLHPRTERRRGGQGRESVEEESTARTSMWKCSAQLLETATSTHYVCYMHIRTYIHTHTYYVAQHFCIDV